MSTVASIFLALLFAPSTTLADGLVTIGRDVRFDPVEAMNHRGDLRVAWQSARRDPQDVNQLAGIIEVRFKPAAGAWQPILSVHVPTSYQFDDGDFRVVQAVLSLVTVTAG